MNFPEIVAHRGMPRRLPENTLQSFEAALASGAQGIELDVHVTRDDIVVVHHDAWLATVDGFGTQRGPAIASLTFAELVARDGGRDIPALADVLSLVADKATVYVEIKALHIEQQVVNVVQSHRTFCAVHGFDHRAPLRVHQLAPDIPVGILQTSYLIDAVAALRACGARDLWQQWEMIDEPLVRSVHDAGSRIVAWTVNDAAAISYLTEIGVDALCTDVSDVVRQQLSSRT
ncbi:MAG: glycerophosphodiester phosphodiesterase [Gemmatimonadaceae bacterium]